MGVPIKEELSEKKSSQGGVVSLNISPNLLILIWVGEPPPPFFLADYTLHLFSFPVATCNLLILGIARTLVEENNSCVVEPVKLSVSIIKAKKLFIETGLV